MQIIRVERGDDRLFCPVTGQQVYDEEGVPAAATLRGSWHEEIADEPIIADGDLEDAWETYVQKAEVEDDGDLDIQAFLAGLDRPGWVAIQLTVREMACGPTGWTFWTVLDLEHEPGAGAVGNLEDALRWEGNAPEEP